MGLRVKPSVASAWAALLRPAQKADLTGDDFSHVTLAALDIKMIAAMEP
jgi:hypothetical protein